jgi:hypothetical protein
VTTAAQAARMRSEAMNPDVQQRIDGLSERLVGLRGYL